MGALISFFIGFFSQLSSSTILSSLSNTKHVHQYTFIVITVHLHTINYFFEFKNLKTLNKKYQEKYITLAVSFCCQPEHVKQETFSADDNACKGSNMHQIVSIKHVVHLSWNPAFWDVQCINQSTRSSDAIHDDVKGYG